jgi:uncharacterized protein
MILFCIFQGNASIRLKLVTSIISTLTNTFYKMPEIITVNSRKSDNSIQRSWQCEFLEETSGYWLFVGKFDREITHNDLGVIRLGTISYEYYFKTEWFNVFRFHEPEGDFKFYYCNINMPPKFENNVLDYVDLDLDVLVRKDLSFVILDEDEFAENSKLFGYSAELKLQVETTLNELLLNITQRQFPFDSKIS